MPRHPSHSVDFKRPGVQTGPVHLDHGLRLAAPRTGRDWRNWSAIEASRGFLEEWRAQKGDAEHRDGNLRLSARPQQVLWHYAISLTISHLNLHHISTRLTLDTATMIAAVRSDAGATRRLLFAALERRCTLLASMPWMIEYQAVMTRPKHLDASGLSANKVNVLLGAVAAVVEPVRLAFCGDRRCVIRTTIW